MRRRKWNIPKHSPTLPRTISKLNVRRPAECVEPDLLILLRHLFVRTASDILSSLRRLLRRIFLRRAIQHGSIDPRELITPGATRFGAPERHPEYRHHCPRRSRENDAGGCNV